MQKAVLGHAVLWACRERVVSRDVLLREVCPGDVPERDVAAANVAEGANTPNVCYLDIHEDDVLDEKQFTAWVK